ncbi:MAG: hypothetical protein WKG01_39020 [Kofleriaceae bacterium]
MSLRSIVVVLVLAACGNGTIQTSSDEPQTAKEKQALEAKQKGNLDARDKSWGTWRYSGDRENCFYVVGRRCFKRENAACQAAKCRSPMKCQTAGAGPATVACK